MIVLIKGMEMPYNCWDCSLLNASSCPCKNYSSALEYTTNRHPNCPLIEVHEPHGRLIDADAALKNIKPIKPEDRRRGCTLETTKRLMMSLIDGAPTVIPASEEG